MNNKIAYMIIIFILIVMSFLSIDYLKESQSNNKDAQTNAQNTQTNVLQDDQGPIYESAPPKDLGSMTQEEYNVSCAEKYNEEIASQYKNSVEKIKYSDEELARRTKCSNNISSIVIDIADGNYDYYSFDSGSRSELKIKENTDIATITINGTTTILDENNPSLLYHNQPGDILTIQTNSKNGIYYFINEFREEGSTGYSLD